MCHTDGPFSDVYPHVGRLPRLGGDGGGATGVAEGLSDEMASVGSSLREVAARPRRMPVLISDARNARRERAWDSRLLAQQREH